MPKIRWHLTETEKLRIRELNGQGWSQTKIAVALNLTRNTICLALKKMGLPTRKPPLIHQEKILELLRQGVQSRKIAQALKVSYRDVYALARKHGLLRERKPLTAQQLEAMKDDILNHRASAFRLSKKYGCPYKVALQLAHSVLACERFLPITKPPLSSYFPQRHVDRNPTNGSL